MRSIPLLVLLTAGCGSTPPPTDPPAPVALPAISADGAFAVLDGADPRTVRVVARGGGAGQATTRPRAELTGELVAMRELPSNGDWSGFADATAQIAMEDRRLVVDLDGQRVFDGDAPWWSDPMPDQRGAHDNGACADEAVEIMRAWIAPAQRRVLLGVDVDFPPCQHGGGLYLVGW